MSVFADAYQELTGGDLQGQEGIAALIEAVSSGSVASSEILPIVARLMRARAAPKLDIAMKTSQAEQERFKNARADAVMLASTSGVESAFLKMFRGMRIALEESEEGVKMLARTLDVAATNFEKLILLPQSFIRALDGRDSLVADWLGINETEQLREDWTTIRNLISDIMGVETPSWLPTLEATTKEIAAMLRVAASFQQFKEKSSIGAKQVIEDTYYSSDLSTPSARTWANIKAITAGNLHTMGNVFSFSSRGSAEYLANREGDIGRMFPDEDSYWKYRREGGMELANKMFENGLGISPTTAGTYIAESKNENKIDVNITVEASNADDVREYFKNEFTPAINEELTKIFSRTMMQTPLTE